MGKRSNRDITRILLSFGGLVVVFIIIVLVNVLLSFANVRWDVTEDNIYSLSKGTKRVLKGISVPVTIKFFYSKSNKNLPNELKLYAKRVREFLAEYERAGQGKIHVQEVDPRPDTDEEDWAQRYGLRSIQVAPGERIYCGLVFTAADQEEVISFVDPAREELLEYDITRSIYRVQGPKKKTIGIISRLPVFEAPAWSNLQVRQQPWLFISELKKTYNVKRISPSAKEIDKDVDLLIIIHPKSISQRLQYAIDQFVLSGKNAIVFVDPFCISDRFQNQVSLLQPSRSSLDRLFKAWGIKMDSSRVVVDMDQATPLRTTDGRIITNPLWITARHDTFSGEEVITSKLERILFPVAGAIEKDLQSPYEFVPLVQTSKHAAKFDAFKANLGIDAIRKEFAPAPEPFILAARITGKFKTAFPEGPPGQKPKEDSTKESNKEKQIRNATKRCSVVVVADADMLADRFYVRKQNVLGLILTRIFNDNLNFVANACEVLTGSDALIEIRSRARFERPFTKVIALKRQAQARWLKKEQELAREMEATNKRLRELEQQKDPSQRILLSPEQEKEIAKFRHKRIRINKELREVRKNLRADIESLGLKLKVINIFVMPTCVSIAGLIFAFYRKRRMRRK